MTSVGIVGCGYWGPNIIRNFYALKSVDFRWACDLVPENLGRVNSQYPTIKTTKDYTELLSDTSLDAIIIATPVETHFKLAKLALEAGKHVLIEKPMTATVEESKELIALAKKQKRVLMVDHTFIYTGAVKKMRDMMEKGEMGQILYFDSVRINLGLIRHDINVIWDLAPHDIAIMLHLIGKRPISVAASGVCQIGNTQEEVGYVTVKFPDNIIGHVHVSWLSPVKVRKIMVGGSDKMVIYDDVEPTEKIKIYDKGVHITPEMKRKETPFNPIYRAGDILIPKIDQDEALLVEAQHFIQCIESNAQPITDGEAGLAVVEILEATTKSLAVQGKEVLL